MAVKRPSLHEITRQAVRQAEREVIFRVLERCKWNRVKAARLLKISYKALLYKMVELDIKQP